MSWRSKSYEVLPALSVRRGELRKSLRIATVSWLFGSAWAVLVSGVQLKSFARMLGFSDFDFGLLASAPAVTAVAMIVGAEIIERSGLRKYQFLYCAVVHRLLWLPIAAIPLVIMVPSKVAVIAMLAIYTASWMMHSFANPAWTTWMGDLVPRRIRGRFFASRFGFGRIIQVTLVVAIGIVLDLVTVKDAPETFEAQHLLMYVICGIFGVGALVGVAEIWMYRKVREIVPPEPQRTAAPRIFADGTWPIVIALASFAALGTITAFTDLLPAGALALFPAFRGLVPAVAVAGKVVFFSLIAAIIVVLISRLKEPMLRRYVAYGITIGFATAVPGFFFFVYTTEYLGFSKLAVQVLYMVISPILGMIGLKVWGKLLDRWGRRPVLMAATFMTVFSVMPYFFSTPHTHWPAFITTAANWIAALIGSWIGKPGWVWITPDMPVGAYLVVSCSILIGGIGWTGVMMGQGNILLGFSDKQGRSRYVAAAAVLVSLGSVVGAPIGGYIVSLINDAKVLGVTELRVGPFIWTAYHATFALSGLARFAALLWLIGMPDPGSGKMRNMVRAMGAVAYTNISSLVLYPFRVFARGPRDDKDGRNH